MKRLVFITGARSEYGISRPLLNAFQHDPEIDLRIMAHGMHLSKDHGYTISEVRKDDYQILCELDTISLSVDKSTELTETIARLHRAIEESKPDAVFIIGDRLEALGAAMAAHLCGVPIIHSGGGHLTAGSADNRYRYMVSILSALHLTTSRIATQRLKAMPVLDASKVFFVGSVAIDAILSFLERPYPISDVIPQLAERPYALITFHPVASTAENVPQILIAAVKTILERGIDVLITAPNNDPGYERVMEAIDSVSANPRVHYYPNLGVPDYYAAIFSCKFVVGNSSSAIMEVPYFRKSVIDVGSRQEGRDKDVGVTTIPATQPAVVQAISEGCNRNWPAVDCNNLYGDGRSVIKAHRVVRKFLDTL